MISRFLLVAAALAASGCIGPIQLRPRFDRTGEYHGPDTPTPVVAAPGDVRVFYGTSPPGFSLRENELKVEPGFPHQILGTVRAERVDGGCNRGTKADVIRVLQEGAFAAGANAVIYAKSALPDQGSERNYCPDTDGESYGQGWAVVLAESSAAPEAPEATTPSAATNAPAPAMSAP